MIFSILSILARARWGRDSGSPSSPCGQLLEVAADGVKHHQDEIKWAKATSFSWTHDHRGFFYSRYPSVDGVSDLGTEVNANENHQVFYHRVGTPQAEDVFVFATPENPKFFVGGSVSDDGRRARRPAGPPPTLTERSFPRARSVSRPAAVLTDGPCPLSPASSVTQLPLHFCRGRLRSRQQAVLRGPGGPRAGG